MVIGTGYASCKYLCNSASYSDRGLEDGRMPALSTRLLKNLEEFMIGDEQSIKEDPRGGTMSSLLSGSLSMALCCILVGDFWFCADYLLIYADSFLSSTQK